VFGVNFDGILRPMNSPTRTSAQGLPDEGINTPLDRLEKLAKSLDVELFLRSAASADDEDSNVSTLLKSAMSLDDGDSSDVGGFSGVSGDQPTPDTERSHDPSALLVSMEAHQLGRESFVPQDTGVSRFLDTLKGCRKGKNQEVLSSALLKRNFEEEDDMSSDYDSDADDESELMRRAEARRNDVSVFSSGPRIEPAGLAARYACLEALALGEADIEGLDAVAEFSVRPDVSAGKLQGALVEALEVLDTHEVDIRSLNTSHFFVSCDGRLRIDVQFCIEQSMRQRVIVCTFSSLCSSVDPHGNQELQTKRFQFIEHMWQALRTMQLALSSLESVSEQDACSAKDSRVHGPAWFGLDPVFVRQMQELVLYETVQVAQSRPEKALVHVALSQVLLPMYQEHGLETDGLRHILGEYDNIANGAGADDVDVSPFFGSIEHADSRSPKEEMYGTALTKCLVQVDRLSDLLRMRCQTTLQSRADSVLTDLCNSGVAQSSPAHMSFLDKFRSTKCAGGGGGARQGVIVSSMKFRDTVPLYYCRCISSGTYPCTLYVTPRLVCLYFTASGSKQALLLQDLCHVSQDKAVLTLSFEHFIDTVEVRIAPMMADVAHVRLVLETAQRTFDSNLDAM